MKTGTTNLTRPTNLISLLPTDLRAWLPVTELARSAREAAETFYWLEADEEDHTPFGGCAWPRGMCCNGSAMRLPKPPLGIVS